MIGLIRAEFLKIRTTRTVYGLLAAMLALVGFGVFTTLGNDPYSWRSTPLVDQEFLFMTGSIMWLFVLIVALRSFTDEFRHGSIVPTLLTTPERRRVLLAKIAAVATTGVIFAVAAYALALAIGLPRLASQGAETSVATGPMAILLAKGVLSSVLWAGLGVGLGLAVRHQVAAIVGAFVWIFFVETFMAELAPTVATYLPLHTWIALNGPPDPALLAPLAGGLLLAAWTSVSIGLGATMMQRRDIG